MADDTADTDWIDCHGLRRDEEARGDDRQAPDDLDASGLGVITLRAARCTTLRLIEPDGSETEIPIDTAAAPAKDSAKEKARLKAIEAEAAARALEEEEARAAEEAAAAAKAKAEAERKAKAEAEAKAKAEAEKKTRLEAEAEAKRQAEEKAKREADEKARAEAEAKAKAEAERKAKEEAEKKAKAEAEAKAKREAEEKARLEAEAKAKREAEEKARKEAEEKARREAEAKAKKEAEEKARREVEAKAKKEAEEKARKEAEAKAKAEAEAKAKREAEEKARKEAEEKARREAEEKAKQEAEEKARREAEAKAKKEAEEKARREAEAKAKKEAEDKARKEAEAKKAAEEKARREAEAKAKAEAEKKAKEEAKAKAKAEAERKAKEEAERKAREEAEAKAKAEEEARAKEEAERKAKVDAARKVAEKDAEKARQQARDLGKTFRRLIRETGPISLAQYMAESNARYYTSRDPLGEDADFITAPEISQMFGELIGLWLTDLWVRMGARKRIHYVELGPGRGTLASDALRTGARYEFDPQVHFVETSPALRKVQLETFPGAIHHDDLSTLPDDAPLLIVANEFFDALPVHQLIRSAEGWHERLVGLSDDGKGEDFVFVAGNEPMDTIVPRSWKNASQGTMIETSAAAATVMEEIASRLTNQGGAALIIDYGAFELRSGSTLQALKEHKKVDVFDHPGQADLTAHVDFEMLKHVAEANGAEVMGIQMQGEWLRQMGIDVRHEALNRKNPGDANTLKRQYNRLVDDAQMGTLFKVLGVCGRRWPIGVGFD